MSTLEKRIDALEQRIGIVADGFAARLNEDDAGFYGAIMRRWAGSRQTFEHFIRVLERGELERLLQIHIDGLAAAGVGLEDLEGLDAGETG